MRNQRAALSSKDQTWRTPEEVLKPVRQYGLIGLDPCASAYDKHHFARTNWTWRDDGLPRSWGGHGLVYVNPPYGDALPVWLAKCEQEHRLRGTEIIACVPARVDTAWFPWDSASLVGFWYGRIKFVGAKNGAFFPSAIIYWGFDGERFRSCFARYCKIIRP